MSVDGTDLVYGVSVTGAVLGITQVIKTALPGLPSNLYPVIALVLGVVITVLLSVGNGEPFHISQVAMGIGYGLAAAGTYSGVKTMATG